MKGIIAAAGICATLALVAGASGAHAGPDAFPAAVGRIVVLSEYLFGPRLLLLDASGREEATVGAPVGIRSEGAVSPDGTSMAMASTVSFFDEGPDSELLLFGFGGTGEILTRNASNEGRPSWSPDGRTIAFASDRDGDWDVYLASVDDADRPLRNLTEGSSAHDRNPRWSPDGTRIAFESDRDGDVDVYATGTDGTAVTPLAPGPSTERLGDWAPDSSRLVISSDRAGRFDLYVVLADAAAEPVRITSAPGNETHASWAPDGGSIAFSSDRDGDTEVFVVRPDGGEERRLTNNPSEDLVLDWQPLRDTRPPLVRALASTGVRGRDVRLRFTISEDSRLASVSYTITLTRGRASGSLSQGSYVPGRVYAIEIPAEFGSRQWPATFRFCVEASDPSANASATSCARFRFVRKR